MIYAQSFQEEPRNKKQKQKQNKTKNKNKKQKTKKKKKNSAKMVMRPPEFRSLKIIFAEHSSNNIQSNVTDNITFTNHTIT